MKAAEDEIWQWFSAALAWTVFRLPAGGHLTLSAGSQQARFDRGYRQLDCRIVAESMDATKSEPWPARYADYEAVAESTAPALRQVMRLRLPLLRLRARTDDSDRAPDIGVLGPARFDEYRTRPRPISPHVYHWHRAAITLAATTTEERGRVTVTPTDYFTGALRDIR
jgi:hypothetical protein